MAKKEALRELQTRLADRLQAARTQADTATWLAVESAGHGFLLPLGQAGEIFPVGTLVPVPHTQPWFVGVANLRGRLHGVVDLAGFLGLSRGMTDFAREQSRVIAFNPTLETNSAVLVERLSGLRNREQLQALPDSAARPAFAGTRYQDASGRQWQELQLSALVNDEAFLRIAH
jgi:twitching motility protein PilI